MMKFEVVEKKIKKLRDVINFFNKLHICEMFKKQLIKIKLLYFISLTIIFIDDLRNPFYLMVKYEFLN